VARQGLSFTSWNRTIWLFVAPHADGSEIHMVMTMWQLTDFGIGKRILKNLKATLV